MSSTDIEKKNLEAHVELCAVRYKNLESTLDALDKRMTAVEEHLIAIRECISQVGQNNKVPADAGDKQLISIGTTIVGVLIAGIITLLVNYINKP